MKVTKIYKNFAAAGLVVLGVLGVISGGRAETISDKQVIEQFRRVVFYAEAGEGAAGMPLRKWSGRVSATIYGGKPFHKNVINLLKRISRLAGLKFSLALIPKQADLK